MKRIISVLLAFILVLSVSVLGVSASDQEDLDRLIEAILEYCENTEAQIDPEPEPEPEEIYEITELERQHIEVTYGNYWNALSADVTNHALVVYIGFSDSAPLDKAAFEDMFVGQYDLDNCLRSVSSYFYYTTYGKEPFDFGFAYYEDEMTANEAWHYVNDEDAYGDFKGNDYLFEVFDELKAEGSIDPAEYDADGDGYVDVVIFITGDSHLDGWVIYGGAMGMADRNQPNPASPVLGQYVKLSGYFALSPLTAGSGSGEYTRTIIHELGHTLGLRDYYDMYGGDDDTDTLGCFDMQSFNIGEWNPFSKLSCGFMDPMVIEDVDTVTLKLRCSSEYSDVVLIPTSNGWNGTPFDEYLLIDVMANIGANGFDWVSIRPAEKNKNGGVRILHVDARLAQGEYGNYRYVEPDMVSGRVLIPHTNSNGYESGVQGSSRFYHLIDLIPSDGTHKYRIQTSPLYSRFTEFSHKDLFGPGETFSVDTHAEAFPNGTTANNGAAFNYSVTVNSYNEVTHEAIITITRIH